MRELTSRRACLSFCVIVLLAGSSAHSVRAQEQERKAGISTSLQDERSKFEVKNGRAENVGTRDLMDSALLTLLTDGNVADAERDMSETFDTQDGEQSSSTFGEVRWQAKDPGVTDRNAIEFASEALGPILNQSEHPLPADFLASFRSHILQTVEGIRRHPVAVAYTNIYLMKCTNLILIGQYLGDNGILQEGEADLASWLSYTRSNGIGEFDSPTYYAVDLDILVEGYRYARNPHDKAVYRAALDYFWADIGANYLPAAHKVTGPASRDYEFVDGNGDLNEWLSAVGWEPAMPKVANLQSVFIYDNLRSGGYTPSASARQLGSSGTRDVTSTWDAIPTHVRSNWVTQHVALGCADGYVGGQDKLFSATFGGSSTLAQMSIVPDNHNAPYGPHTMVTKPEHRPAEVACVEHGGAALVTLDVNPAIRPNPLGLNTSVLLPADAAIDVDGRPVSVKPGDNIPVGFNSTVSATIGSATVAFKLIQADAVSGQRPAVTLTTDAAGYARHAVWLNIANLPPGQLVSLKHMRISFFFLAEDDGSPATVIGRVQNTSVSESVRGDVWDSVATLPGGNFEIQRSATDAATIFALLDRGAPVARRPLSSNGLDLASPIWSSIGL